MQFSHRFGHEHDEPFLCNTVPPPICPRWLTKRSSHQHHISNGECPLLPMQNQSITMAVSFVPCSCERRGCPNAWSARWSSGQGRSAARSNADHAWRQPSVSASVLRRLMANSRISSKREWATQRCAWRQERSAGSPQSTYARLATVTGSSTQTVSPNFNLLCPCMTIRSTNCEPVPVASESFMRTCSSVTGCVTSMLATEPSRKRAASGMAMWLQDSGARPGCAGRCHLSQRLEAGVGTRNRYKNMGDRAEAPLWFSYAFLWLFNSSSSSSSSCSSGSSSS